MGWGGQWRNQQGGPDCGGCEGRARAERTSNMAYMNVTLGVSRLSGWLNAKARCRVERESIGGGATCGQAGGGGRWRKQQGGPPTLEAEGRARAERTLNMNPMYVTLDVSKLSGWLNTDAYCRVTRGNMGGGATCGQGGRRVGRGGRWRKHQRDPNCGG